MARTKKKTIKKAIKKTVTKPLVKKPVKKTEVQKAIEKKTKIVFTPEDEVNPNNRPECTFMVIHGGSPCRIDALFDPDNEEHCGTCSHWDNNSGSCVIFEVIKNAISEFLGEDEDVSEDVEPVIVQ